jgi:cytochrome c nitrite reductase small subunit
LDKLKELIIKLLQTKFSTKAKILIVLGLLGVVVVGGGVGYAVFDYTQTNPKFCVSCHLMNDAYTKWDQSVHTGINCHDCHHLSIQEMNTLMFNFIVHRPTELPDRHGKVIVPWKYCVGCHWEADERYPGAPNINQSALHSKHYFTEQIECSKCHGYKAHMFKPEPSFCVMCHEGKEVHSEGMEGLNCLNCHTDNRADLRPDRDKCLYCHGTDTNREELVAEGRLDVRFCGAVEDQVEVATKINLNPDSPMQFLCFECHHPHDQPRPDAATCTGCHPKQAEVGRHRLHVEDAGMVCTDCHIKHVWTVTKAQAKETCTQCHAYRSPESFLR